MLVAGNIRCKQNRQCILESSWDERYEAGRGEGDGVRGGSTSQKVFFLVWACSFCPFLPLTLWIPVVTNHCLHPIIDGHQCELEGIIKTERRKVNLACFSPSEGARNKIGQAQEHRHLLLQLYEPTVQACFVSLAERQMSRPPPQTGCVFINHPLIGVHIEE